MTGRNEETEAREFQEMVEENFRLSGASNIGDFVPMMKWIGLSSIEKEMIKLNRKIDSCSQEMIESHRRTRHHSFKGSKTIIDVLLSLQETEPEYYTDEIIRGLIQVMILRGTDTSASTLEWALSLLLNHPDSLKKTVDEIDKKVGSSRLINDSDLSHLPYLHGVINETLRMCPAAALIPAHESTEECTIGGFRVPSGTMLFVNLWAIQNDPKIWKEPEKFKPERFVDVEGQRDGFKFMPFGSGRRGCPGEAMAMRNIYVPVKRTSPIVDVPAEKAMLLNDQLLYNKRFSLCKPTKVTCWEAPWLQLHSSYLGLIWRPLANLRKIASIEILSNKRINMFTNIRHDEMLSLVSSLNGQSQKGQSVIVDMKSCFFKVTLNTLTRTITERNEETEAREFQEMLEENFRISGASNIGDFVPMVMISAGTDTSANTLEWALSLLLNHPDSLKKTVDEIDKKVL
ncbi:isoflavone 2'-hydroxylase-like protein [Tanacetum coccineum]